MNNDGPPDNSIFNGPKGSEVRVYLQNVMQSEGLWLRGPRKTGGLRGYASKPYSSQLLEAVGELCRKLSDEMGNFDPKLKFHQFRQTNEQRSLPLPKSNLKTKDFKPGDPIEIVGTPFHGRHGEVLDTAEWGIVPNLMHVAVQLKGLKGRYLRFTVRNLRKIIPPSPNAP